MSIFHHMIDLSRALARKLLQIKAINLNIDHPYQWASGIISPIYCDNRVVLSDVEAREMVLDGFLALAKDFEDVDVIAGVATGAIAHGMLVADRLQKPFIYIRSAPKGHGLQNLIEGRLHEGENVLVIEDLISTAGSSIKAVKAVEANGGDVQGLLAIFTYGLPQAEVSLQDADVTLRTITNFNILIEEAVNENYINSTQLPLLQKWAEDPANWASKVNL